MIRASIRASLFCAAALTTFSGCKKKDAPAPKPVAQPVKPPAPTQPVDWRVAIKSPDLKLRAEACAAVPVGELKSTPPELLAALGDAAPDVRKAAARAIVGFAIQFADTTALPKLLELAEKEKEPSVRAEVIRTLGALTHRDVTPVLVKVLGTEKDPAVRDEIIASFGRSGDRRALPAVLAMLREKEPSAVVFEALRRLATEVPPELGKLLAHPKAEIRRLAAQALGEMGDRAATAALSEATKDKDPLVAAEAVASLALLGGPEPVKTIIALVDHGDAKVRVAAIRALATYRTPGEIPADEALPKVLAHLKAGQPEERVESANTLGAMAVRRAVPALREIAANGKEPLAVRMASIAALGQLADEAALPTLIDGLKDTDPDVRTASAKSIGLFRTAGATATDALTAAWKKNEPDIDAQVEIVKAFGLIGAQGAVPLLKEIGEKNPVPLVKAEAGGALIRLGKVEGATILRPILTASTEWQERRAAARLLEARSWKERKDEKETPEQQALVTAVTTLITDALKTEAEPLVRETLYRQLGKAKGPAALPALKAGMSESVPFFRLMASAGLCRNGDQSGCDDIVKSLDHGDAHVRAEAARRAGWYHLQAAVAGLKKLTADPVLTVANAAQRSLNRIEGGVAAAETK